MEILGVIIFLFILYSILAHYQTDRPALYNDQNAYGKENKLKIGNFYFSNENKSHL